MTSRTHNNLSVTEVFRQAKRSERAILFTAAWFGVGFMPFAPGTFGSLAALPFAAAAYSSGIIPSIVSFVLIISLSIWASGEAAKILKREDPSPVVIDETAGIFVTMFLIPLSWISIITGFILFRFFDIIKPFPVGFIDRRVKGGKGIVLDDLMAGVYANAGVRVILFLIDRFEI